MDLLKKGLTTGDPDFTWEAYFVLAAKPNKTVEKQLIEAFGQAWDLNVNRDDLWKMIEKLRECSVLLSESVLRRIFDVGNTDVLFSFFDRIIEFECYEMLYDSWMEIDGDRYIESMMSKEPHQPWERVKWIVSYIIDGKPYPLGSLESFDV